MTRLRKNLIANFAGQGAATLIQLAVTPVYIRYLGIEAYGLIGFQITLSSPESGARPGCQLHRESRTGPPFSFSPATRRSLAISFERSKWDIGWWGSALGSLFILLRRTSVVIGSSGPRCLSPL